MLCYVMHVMHLIIFSSCICVCICIHVVVFVPGLASIHKTVLKIAQQMLQPSQAVLQSTRACDYDYDYDCDYDCSLYIAIHIQFFDRIGFKCILYSTHLKTSILIYYILSNSLIE